MSIDNNTEVLIKQTLLDDQHEKIRKFYYMDKQQMLYYKRRTLPGRCPSQWTIKELDYYVVVFINVDSSDQLFPDFVNLSFNTIDFFNYLQTGSILVI
jgi:hypothetical protein